MPHYESHPPELIDTSDLEEIMRKALEDDKKRKEEEAAQAARVAEAQKKLDEEAKKLLEEEKKRIDDDQKKREADQKEIEDIKERAKNKLSNANFPIYASTFNKNDSKKAIQEKASNLQSDELEDSTKVPLGFILAFLAAVLFFLWKVFFK